MAGGEEGFIVIRRFMIKQLKLQGVPLLLYARIYGFTVGGGAGCYESQRSMAESLGVSERAIGKALRIPGRRGWSSRSARIACETGARPRSSAP